MSPRKGFLLLEDGAVYEGVPFGAEGVVAGEVVFTTAMTGYQEVLTDPSYAGQIVVPTYPLMGNYGVNEQDFESREVQVSGFVVRQWCDTPSHGLSRLTLHDFLSAHGVPGLSEVDTRALTRRLRTRGVMMGVLAHGLSVEEARDLLRRAPTYGSINFVERVSTSEAYNWPGFRGGGPGEPSFPEERVHPVLRIAVLDWGVKFSILRLLARRGCEVVVLPAGVGAEEVLALGPAGVVLSPGPGDPALLEKQVETARRLVGRVPVFGICLGHQVLARAFGGGTFKLKFGHRGANHPVKDLSTGRVFITSQNHGYAVDPDTLPPDLEVSQVNLTDGTVEGLRHRSLPLFSIQYHAEASPGPRDNEYLFDRFLEMVREAR